MSHPTTGKERLMNKILSHMMINCRDNIDAAQIEELQTHKDSPADFDWSQKEYAPLLDFNLDHFTVNPKLSEEKQKAPVDLSREEIRMQTVVEVSTYYNRNWILSRSFQNTDMLINNFFITIGFERRHEA
jgi:hypothetical protein